MVFCYGCQNKQPSSIGLIFDSGLMRCKISNLEPPKQRHSNRLLRTSPGLGTSRKETPTRVPRHVSEGFNRILITQADGRLSLEEALGPQDLLEVTELRVTVLYD